MFFNSVSSVPGPQVTGSDTNPSSDLRPPPETPDEPCHPENPTHHVRFEYNPRAVGLLDLLSFGPSSQTPSETIIFSFTFSREVDDSLLDGRPDSRGSVTEDTSSRTCDPQDGRTSGWERPGPPTETSVGGDPRDRVEDTHVPLTVPLPSSSPRKGARGYSPTYDSSSREVIGQNSPNKQKTV